MQQGLMTEGDRLKNDEKKTLKVKNIPTVR